MLVALTLWTLTHSAPVRDPLEESFVHPPQSARPQTWWHWMDGNVSKEGITADLEAMKEVGIGGAQMFTVSQGIPPGPAGYMSDTWREMTAHAVKEADRIGIELCIHNCAGWSSSGGPWIKPEYAMQVLAWSETKVTGPTEFSDQLPQPKAPQVFASVPYYKDIAVYAFPTPKAQDAARAQDALGRTGVNRQDGLEPNLTAGPVDAQIQRDAVLTLSSKMDASGKLTWSVPAGNWTILRLGHVPTGKDNHPAPPEGDGLEVDKLSREAMDQHWNGMMAKVISDVGPLAGKVLNNALIDSYEVHSQNWTPRFREEFQKRRGYDPMPYLPTIAGFTIESREVTERFLWDMRRTIADLFADNYYRYFGELCHKNGMAFSTEPYGDGGFDNIQSGGTADIPMGEFWIGGSSIETTKLAASVGHVFGRSIVGAESFTADDVRGRWLEEPYAAKALGDEVFCNGVNRYIFHRYAQQPWLDLFPGMTMGPWGTHLERTQTWWTEAKTWLGYVARCQSLLQQGKFVADALYCTGESAPADLPYRPNLKPSLPKGYDYDGCDAETVLKRLTVKNNRLTLPDGMSYRVLIMPETQLMTPEMASALLRLVKAGATIVAPKPQHSPSLVNFPDCERELAAVSQTLWGNLDGKTHTERAVASGKVIWGKPLKQVFADMKLAPDFAATGNNKMAYIHRKIGQAEVYFVSNQQYRSKVVDCQFRMSGMQPELWHPDTGAMEPAPVYDLGAQTKVSLKLDPAESVFVVFRKKASPRHLVEFKSQEELAIKAATIVIKKAVYGVPDGSKGADVTAIVAQLVSDGQTEISASNGLFGDPAYNFVKQLSVTYTVNGREVTRAVPENETLELVSSAQGDPAPTYDFNGQGLAIWKAGTYKVKYASGKQMQLISRGATTFSVGGLWKVKFKPGWGAPESVEFPKLINWIDSKDDGIRHFSGSATYAKTIAVPSKALGAHKAVVLDLGKVKNFATVKVNGHEVGVLWKEPFRIDVGSFLKPGNNQLEIKVTNLWVNRIIGDEALPEDAKWHGVTLDGWPDWLKNHQPRPKTGRYTFTTWKFWKKDSKLLDSGLIGPVVIRSTDRMEFN